MKRLATLAIAASVLASAGAHADRASVAPAPGAASSAPGAGTVELTV